jgi:hypothetical protein
MKKHLLPAALAIASLSSSAMAADYYRTATYPVGDGLTAEFVESATIRTNDSGYRIADITNVDSHGVATWVFTQEVDCKARTWHAIYKVAYRVDEMTAPLREFPNPPEKFAGIDVKAPERKTMDFICAWPKRPAGVTRSTAVSAIALSKKIAPTLQVKPKGEPRLGVRPGSTLQ